MIDVCYIHSYVVNSVVTKTSRVKFLHNVNKLSPSNLLKSELQYCNPFWNANVLNEGYRQFVANSWQNLSVLTL